MNEIYFYEDAVGNSPIFEYIQSLSNKSDKDSRINYNKINDYIEVLAKHGNKAGEPYMKHIEDDIWEVRPKREIEQAKRNLKDIRERSKYYEDVERS